MPGRAAVDLDMCEAAAPQIVSLIGNDVTLRHKRSGETQRLANMSGDGEAAAIGKFFEPDRQRRAGDPPDVGLGNSSQRRRARQDSSNHTAALQIASREVEPDHNAHRAGVRS